MAEPASAPTAGLGKGLVVVIALVLLAVGIGAGWALSGALSAPQRPPASTIEKVYRTGVMVVGTDAAFPPFENVNATTGQIEGFDIDIINEVAAFMGVRADIRNTGWDPLFVQIPDRTLDIAISAMTITAERNNTLLFSDPYFLSDQTIVIRQGGPMVGVINEPADLDGRRVAAQRGTTGEAWIEDTLIAQMMINAEYVPTMSYTDSIALLSADEVDAVVIDKPVAEGYESAGVVTIVYTIVTNEAFGIPMHLGESALKAVINAALKHIRDTGKYDELIEKWFVA
jgi:ABC-type amino acid transport substrate-binding protein